MKANEKRFLIGQIVEAKEFAASLNVPENAIAVFQDENGEFVVRWYGPCAECEE